MGDGGLVERKKEEGWERKEEGGGLGGKGRRRRVGRGGRMVGRDQKWARGG